jgi:hypothetical protein
VETACSSRRSPSIAATRTTAREHLIACEAVALVEAEPKQHRHLTMAWLAYHEGRFHDAAKRARRRARGLQGPGRTGDHTPQLLERFAADGLAEARRPTPRHLAHHPERGGDRQDGPGRLLQPAEMSSAERLASFEIIKRLGAGGMAEVFLAKKLGAEGTYKLLVLKRIHPSHARSRRFRAMFVEEAHLATRLNHPNIVQVYEFLDHGDEGLLLAMEYVEGYDLGRLMSVARQKGSADPAVGQRHTSSRGSEGAALRPRAQGRTRCGARHRPPRRLPAEHPRVASKAP